MKNALLVIVLAAPVVAVGADLTGAGYIYITEPSTVWTPPSNVTGTARFMWYPDKAALRFGDLQSGYQANWNSANIGEYSFAGGMNAKAAGSHSFAFGQGALSNGSGNIAFGHFAYANGGIAIGTDTQSLDTGATAIGIGAIALGYESLALMRSSAEGLWTVSIGIGAWALSECDISLGAGAYSEGPMAIAIGGDLTQAIGASSIAIGHAAQVVGNGAITIGTGDAYAGNAIMLGHGTNDVQGAIALGGVNTKRMDGTSPSPTSANAKDPIFMVGVNSDQTPSSNALTVYRNGDGHFNGALRVPERGDIPMGSYKTKPTGVQFQ